MNKRKAKRLSLKVWRYFRDHPECTDKGDLPDELYEQVRYLCANCPLCEVFIRQKSANVSDKCGRDQEKTSPCPLASAGEWCYKDSSAYSRWLNSKCSNVRAKMAAKIVNIIEGWKVP